MTPRRAKAATEVAAGSAPAQKARAESWSPRSQRSLHAQYDLEQRIEKFRNLIGFEERMLAKAEENRIRQARQVADGQRIYERNLEETLKEIEGRKAKVAAYRDVLAGLRKEVEALQPSHSEAADRLRKQRELAGLARSRVAQDCLIDSAVQHLLGLLAARAEVTGAMLTLAREIDFSITGDFDSARFDRLAASLPDRVQAETKRWLDWFFGEEREKRPCEITRELEVFPETLAAANFYRKGERPLLTEQQRVQAEREEPRPLTPAETEELVKPKREPEPEYSVAQLPGGGLVRGTIL
jgi:hypothetical protein